MRKIILVITLIISTLSGVFAQQKTQTSGETDADTPPQPKVTFENPRPEWKDRLRYGGTFGLGLFGSFYGNLSPLVGYEINDKGTLVGVGATFIYQATVNRNSPNVSNFTYGPKIFIRQQLFRRFFAHAEYELVHAYADQFYSYLDTSNPANASVKRWGGSPLVGLGYYQGGGDSHRGSYLSLLYNLGYPNTGFISPSILGSGVPITIRYGLLF